MCRDKFTKPFFSFEILERYNGIIQKYNEEMYINCELYENKNRASDVKKIFNEIELNEGWFKQQIELHLKS